MLSYYIQKYLHLKFLFQNDNLVVVIVTVANLNGRVGGVGRSKVRLRRGHASFSPHKELPEGRAGGAVGAPLLSSSPTDKAVVPTCACKGGFVVIIVVIRILEEGSEAKRGRHAMSSAASWRRSSGEVEGGRPKAVEGHRHLRSRAASRSSRTRRS